MITHKTYKTIASSTFENEIKRTGSAMLRECYIRTRAMLEADHPHTYPAMKQFIQTVIQWFSMNPLKPKYEVCLIMCMSLDGRDRDMILAQLNGVMSKVKWATLMFEVVKSSAYMDFNIPMFSQLVLNNRVAPTMNGAAPLEAYEEWQRLPSVVTVYQGGYPMGDSTQLWALSFNMAVVMASQCNSERVELRRAVLRKDESYVVLRKGEVFLLSPFALVQHRLLCDKDKLDAVNVQHIYL